MGEIAKRRIERTAHNVLLVGQAPGADGDVRPLTGTMGVRLADLMGVDAAVVVPASTSRPPSTTPKDEIVGLFFDRANVLDFYPGRSGKGHAFPLGHARLAAQEMWPKVLEYERVVFCGKAVKDSFIDTMTGTRDHPLRRSYRKAFREAEMLTWYAHATKLNDTGAFLWAWMPHTSMIVPWWNDPANVELARRFLTDLANWTIWGREEKAA